MAVSLEIRAISQSLTTLDGLRVVVTARNDTQGAVLLPDESDRSAALTICSQSGDREVRRANGLTHQDMMTTARRDERTSMEPLAPGAERTWSFDLIRYQYPLPAGQFSVYAECSLEDGSVVRSNAVTVDVDAVQPEKAALVRDNPILDGTALLLGLARAGAKEWRVRLYNTRRPLAPWFCAAVALPESAEPLLATAAFFRTDTFDHFFDRWVVARELREVVALRLLNGEPTGEQRRAQLPANAARLLGAIVRPEQELLIFVETQQAEIECHAFGASRLDLRFRVPAPVGSKVPPVVVGFEDRVAIAAAAGGIDRLDVDYQGAVLLRERLFNTDLEVFDLRFDPVDDCIKAGFWDGRHGEHLQLVAVRGTQPRVFYREREADLRDLLELGWDVDAEGQFHVVPVASSGLYYWSSDARPELVLEPAGERKPLVIAQDRTFIAFADAERGYNFYEYRRGLRLREGEST